MIIDHTHPLYVKKRNSQVEGNKYNGAYYYSKEIVKNIIPNLIDKTDRNWVTVRLPDVSTPPHSIVFIHNNRNPNYYSYLKDCEDVVAVCSQPKTAENMKFFTDKVIYLPLSVDIAQVEKYKVKHKTKETAFAGRKLKINNYIPSNCDILTDMPQGKLLKEMAKYEKIYAVGRCAIQAKILECKVLPYDNMYPDPRIWRVIDNYDAAKMLLAKLNEIDEKII